MGELVLLLCWSTDSMIRLIFVKLLLCLFTVIAVCAGRVTDDKTEAVQDLENKKPEPSNYLFNPLALFRRENKREEIQGSEDKTQKRSNDIVNPQAQIRREVRAA